MKGTDTVLRAVWAFFFFFFRVDSQIQSECVCVVCIKIEKWVCCSSFISLSLSDADCDKITAALLKSRTGEFDLESILFLKLRGLGKMFLTPYCFFYLKWSLLSFGCMPYRNTRPWMHWRMYEPGTVGPLRQ